MAIIGVGIDVVDIERFGQSLDRTPGLAERLFTPPSGRVRWPRWPPASPPRRPSPRPSAPRATCSWHDAEVVSEESGRPVLELRGTVLARADDLGATSVHLSLSHDAGIASAVVVLEG